VFTLRRLSRFFALSMIVVLIIGTSQAAWAGHSTQTIPASSSPALAGAIKGSLVSGPQTDPALDAPPPAAQAVVKDPQNPDWTAYYGSQAGLQLFPARIAPSGLSLNGPKPALKGSWQITTLQAGTNKISALASAPDGRLFAGVQGDGLRVYAPDANGVYSWTAIRASQNGLASNNVTCLAVYKGELWIGTSDAGVSALNLTDGTWRQINPGLTPLPSNTVNSLTVGYPISFLSGPFIWVGTNNGAAQYNGSNWTVLNTGNSSLPDNNVLDVALQRITAGINIIQLTWFATSSQVAVWNGASGWTLYNTSNTGACGIYFATRIVVDNNQDVWLAAFNVVPNQPLKTGPNAPQAIESLGLCRYHSGTWTLYGTVTPGLPSNDITDLSLDDAGRLWITTNLGGASYDHGAWAFYTQNNSGIYSNDINKVLAVGEAVWFGHNGATVLSQYSPNWLRFSAADMGGAGSPHAALIENSTVWIGLGANLARFDQNTGFTSLTLPANTAAVTSIAREGSGALWIGTAGNGLYEYDGASFSHQTTSDGVPSNTIRALLGDRQGRLWAASDSGLGLHGNGYWLDFNSSNSPLPSNDLRALAQDATDRIWIGTGANGISILDLNSSGAGMWSAQTSSDGLPANSVHGLAADGNGGMWAATTAGVGMWDPTSGHWTTYNQAGSSIPSDQVVSIAADPLGRIWAGTAGGLSLKDGNSWNAAYHVSGSTLGSDQASSLASDGDLLWTTAGADLSVRSVITGPIGTFAPVINSFTPTSGSPSTVITISGNYFDGRGPQFNQAWIGTQNGSGGVQAQILSVSATSMQVEVPFNAHSGKILVTSNGLSVESAADFTVIPQISSLSGLHLPCLSLGDTLWIFGGGWSGPDLTWVKIGNGAWRQADYRDPGLIRQIIRPGDTDGQVSVRIGTNGTVVTSSASVSIGVPQVSGVYVQQGVQGEPLIWDKRTLVQVALKTSGCTAHVDGGTLYFKWKGGSTSTDAQAYFTSVGGLQVNSNAPGQVSLNTMVNFVAEPLIGGSLANFDGMRFTLKNGPVTLLTYDIPASSFQFSDPNDRHHILVVPILPPGYTANQYSDFLNTEDYGLQNYARFYPQSDRYYPDWITQAIIYFSENKVDLNSGDFDRVRGEVDDYRNLINDSGGDLDQAVALVAKELYTGGPSGKAVAWCIDPFSDCSKHTSVVFNFPDGYSPMMAPVFGQETVHGLNWVQSNSPNYASYNPYHSRYDQGQYSDNKNCDLQFTFRQALVDQLGYPARVVWLGKNAAPLEFPLTGCDPATQPRSVMSYAANPYNTNSFYEPLDFNNALQQILAEPATNQPTAAAAQAASQSLRIDGNINLAGQVDISLSYLSPNMNSLTSDDPFGSYHLVLLSSTNQALLDQTFDLGFQSTHGDPITSARFNLHVPFPDGTVKVEIRFNNQTLWSQSVSAHAPSVSFTSPNGGSFAADGSLPVGWTASDADNDPLSFYLEYSPDGGATWQPVALHLTGSSYSWAPGFSPASTTARLRITASDGFNTAQAVSSAFTLTARPPVAVIRDPQNGASFLEGEAIHLDGGSYTSSGLDQGTFSWLRDGAPLGAGQTITDTTASFGTHTYTLNVSDHSLTGTAAITVSVHADYDHDGMADDWELAHHLNPLDPTDSQADPDHDGLTNQQEFQLGTNPQVADTDGDGASDGAEVAAGTDPLNADQKPAASPVLHVGSNDLTFNIRLGEAAPGPETFWVNNDGSGVLNWQASSDAPWLSISPGSGSQPAQLTLKVDPSGLYVGSYRGHITLEAGGAGGSPHQITVTLNIYSTEGKVPIYLPMLRR
jgi:ligand-binding sensor domain-containing protein